MHLFSSVCYRVPTSIFLLHHLCLVSVWTGPNSVLGAHQCTVFFVSVCQFCTWCSPMHRVFVSVCQGVHFGMYSPLYFFYLEDLILFACANSTPCLLCLLRSQLLCAPCLSVSALIGPNFVLVLTSAPRLRVSAWRVQILSVVSAGGSQLLCAHCYITSFLCLSGLAH